MKFIRFMGRPARPVEATILSFVGFAAVVIAGVIMAKWLLPTVLIAVGVALGIGLVGRWVTQSEVESSDVKDEPRAA